MAKKIAKSIGAAAVSTGIGAAGYYAQKVASENIGFVQENWWAGPAVTFAAAALIGTRKGRMASQIGASLATVAGYSAMMGYQLNAAGGDVGAVFEPRQQMALPSVPSEPVFIEETAPAALPEAAAVYADRGPYNHFNRPRTFGR